MISALIAATITVFEPIKSAALNWDELSIGFPQLPRMLLAPVGIAFAL